VSDNIKNNDGEFNPILKGERIYLREVRTSDVTERYYRWMNDPEVGQYLETRFFPHSHEKIESYIREMGADPNNVFLAIVLKNGDLHIGNIKIGPINWFHRFADISLIIGDKTYWGKGYGTEAIGLVVFYAFNTLNLHKITAGIYANNVGSIKAFKKAGFIEEGLRKKHRFCEGEYVDEVLLGNIRSD